MPPSRLSSLLVRDGLVSVKRMEHAFQRQVIYGGGLDTILLEMNLVPEERLVQYLSLATGLPPATRTETEAIDPAVVEQCAADVARMFRVAPLVFEEGALRVLVHDPVDMDLLEELANELEVPVQPLVGPEYRLHLVFNQLYGGLLDTRYATLAKRAEDSTPISPVGKARSVIIDDVATAGSAAAPKTEMEAEAEAPPAEAPVTRPVTARTTTQEMATGALARRIEEAEQARLAAETASAAPGPPAPSPAPADSDALGRQDTTPLDRVSDERQAAPAQPAPPPAESPGRVGTALASTPLDPALAIQALAEAEERDAIFNLLLRAIRSRARYAGLLTVQGDAALGRIAMAEDDLDRDQITQVLIPLDEPSPFRAVARSAAPHLGPIAMADPEIGRMLQRMAVGGAASVLLLPVVLRNRVVAITVGHNGDKPMAVPALPELLPVVRQAADSLSRLIVKSKNLARRRAAEPASEAPVRGAVMPTGQHAAQAGPAPKATDGAPGASGDAAGDAGPITDQMPAPIDSVLSAVESEDPALADHATREALRRAGEVLEALRTRFPGKLLVERYELEGRVISAAQHGPVLALIMQMGVAAAGLLVEKMGDANRDVRYYATSCVSELYPRSAIDALIDRLFDSDYGVRSVAIKALTGYPAGVLERALVRVRQALFSARPESVQAAANALAKLGDVPAVPDLIETVAMGDRGAEHARLALVRLTKQDFGTNARKWRSWFGKSQSHSRVEWLIEGLAHKDENIRRSAVEELRQLTGEYFGFHHDLPKREREQARLRWTQWWKQAGRHRFLRSDGAD